MVTIVDFVKRTNSEGVEFNSLVLQGGIELVKSRQTGNYYATAKRTSISCTFDDAMCQGILGTQIPGSVQRVECEPYDFVAADTKEVISLTHRWVYLKEGESVEERVIADSKVAMPL